MMGLGRHWALLLWLYSASATYNHRRTQEATCQSLLRGYSPSCRCRPYDQAGNLEIDCPNFCSICLEDSDLCTVTSTSVQYIGTDYFFVRQVQQQSGVDSSQSQLRIETVYAGETTECRTFIDNRPCLSCNPVKDGDKCQGAVHDCSNLGYDVVNTCNEPQMVTLPLNSPFITLGSDEFSYSQCASIASTSSPTPAPGLENIVQKKTPRDDDKRDAKLFGGDDSRGTLDRTRALRIRGI